MKSKSIWGDLEASWAILVGIGFMMLANGVQGTLLSVRANIEGFSTFSTGIMMSGYFIGIFIGSFVAPYLVKRVGHIRVFSALASLASISILFHGIYVDPSLWFAMRIVTGICFSGFYIVTESWLNDRASNETRGKILSVYMVIVVGSMGLGQFLMNVAKPEQIDLFILISVIISLGLIPILLTVKPAPSFDSPGKMSIVDLYRASPLAVIGNCMTGMAHGTLFGLGAIYATAALPDVEQVALFMACMMAGGLITQWPIGYMSDRIERRKVMAALSVMAIGCCVLAIMMPNDGPLYYLVIMALGGAAMPMYGVVIAYANDRLNPDQIVAASGSLVMVSGIGLMIGPIVVSFLMDFSSLEFYFLGMAAFFAVILVFTLIRAQIRAAIAVEDQAPLAAGAIGTPIAEYLSPDAVEYAEAVANDELDKLSDHEDVTERQL